MRIVPAGAVTARYSGVRAGAGGSFRSAAAGSRRSVAAALVAAGACADLAAGSAAAPVPSCEHAAVATAKASALTAIFFMVFISLFRWSNARACIKLIQKSAVPVKIV
jgi:hypothetical protein